MRFCGFAVLQVVPHITNEIMDWVERVAPVPVDASGQEADVCLIEVRSTLELPFLGAFCSITYLIFYLSALSIERPDEIFSNAASPLLLLRGRVWGRGSYSPLGVCFIFWMCVL